MNDSDLSKKGLSFYIIYLFLSVGLCFIIMNVDWFNFSPLKYDLDTYTYERVLDAGEYDIDSLYNKDIIGLITSEVIWSLFLTYINNIFTSKFIIFTFIPCIVIFFYSFYISKKSNLFYMLMLLHPIGLMFYLNQLRLAFAFALFYLIVIIFKDRKKFLLLPILIFIHTSMVFFIFIFIAIGYIVKLNISEYKKIIYLLILGTFSAYITGPMISNILFFLGDRRADDYSSDQWQTSILTSLYCMVFIFIIVFNFIVVKSKKINFEISTSIVFFFMVAISPIITGGYPFRFLSAVFPIIVVSFYSLNHVFKYSSIIIMVIIGFYMGIYQLNLTRYVGF